MIFVGDWACNDVTVSNAAMSTAATAYMEYWSDEKLGCNFIISEIVFETPFLSALPTFVTLQDLPPAIDPPTPLIDLLTGIGRDHLLAGTFRDLVAFRAGTQSLLSRIERIDKTTRFHFLQKRIVEERLGFRLYALWAFNDVQHGLHF